MAIRDDAEELIKELRKKIDELIEKAKDASGDVREEMDDTIEKLKRQTRRKDGRL